MCCKSRSFTCWNWCWLWITSLVEDPGKLQLYLRISGAHMNSSMQQQVKKEYCLIHAFTLLWSRIIYRERPPLMSMSIVMRENSLCRLAVASIVSSGCSLTCCGWHEGLAISEKMLQITSDLMATGHGGLFSPWLVHSRFLEFLRVTTRFWQFCFRK